MTKKKKKKKRIPPYINIDQNMISHNKNYERKKLETSLFFANELLVVVF